MEVWYPLGFCFRMSPVGQNVLFTMTATQLGLLSPTRCRLRKRVLWQLHLRLFSPILPFPLGPLREARVGPLPRLLWLSLLPGWSQKPSTRFCMSILTTEQILLSPWHAVGLKCNSHSQMLPGNRRGAISCTHSRRGGGGSERDGNATGREPVLK